jgi:hypothetical protein
MIGCGFVSIIVFAVSSVNLLARQAGSELVNIFVRFFNSHALPRIHEPE